jgi:hypothetical protein
MVAVATLVGTVGEETHSTDGSCPTVIDLPTRRSHCLKSDPGILSLWVSSQRGHLSKRRGRRGGSPATAHDDGSHPRRNTMELSSAATIDALLRAVGKPTRTGRCREPQSAARSVRNDRRMHCKCGRCQQCLDNARWERIFVEKFADPNYYTRQVVRRSSPLMSL